MPEASVRLDLLPAIAAGIALIVTGLPVFLVALFGWALTLDFYLATSTAVALLIYVEEGRS